MKFISTLLSLGSLVAMVSFSCVDEQKIKGISFVAPRNEVPSEVMTPVVELHANYVAIMPYAFVRRNSSIVEFHDGRQHWGESIEGARKTIDYAQDAGLKVMLKPHLWIGGQGWAGDFELNSDEEWSEWQSSYRDYLMKFAEIAVEKEVDIFCIGTEVRKSVVKHPEFWKSLIKEIRSQYNGKITYAANWDNYRNVDFWNELDYIGIDAYWPLSGGASPTLDELIDGWKPIKNELKIYSTKWDRPILFTEYGYESRDYAADGHWKYDVDTLAVNREIQSNAYRAYYRSFYNESWFAGGFVWKWFTHEGAGGADHKGYTPQNKQGELTLKKLFQ